MIEDHNKYLFFRLEMLAMSFRHKTVNELFLWSNLRHKSRDNAGYFDIKKLTRHERYVLLPKLRNKGWVHPTKNRTMRYKKVAGKMCSLAISVKMPVRCLETKHDFKSYIHDAVVKYQLDGNYRYTSHLTTGKKIGKQRYDFRSRSFYKKSKLNQYSEISAEDNNFRRSYYMTRKFSSGKLQSSVETTSQYSGRLARQLTSNFLSLSEGTISRFRKRKICNKYKIDRRIYSHPSQIHPMLKYFYNSNINRYFTVSTMIETDIVMFRDKFARNSKKLMNVISRNGLLKKTSDKVISLVPIIYSNNR